MLTEDIKPGVLFSSQVAIRLFKNLDDFIKQIFSASNSSNDIFLVLETKKLNGLILVKVLVSDSIYWCYCPDAKEVSWWYLRN